MINNLPDEILIVIFSYFDFHTILYTLGEVCQRWKQLTQTHCTCRTMSIESNEDIKFIKSFPLTFTIKSLEIQYIYTTIKQVMDDVLPRFPKLKAFSLHKYNRLDETEVDKLFNICPELRHINIFVKQTVMEHYIEKLTGMESIVLNNTLSPTTLKCIQQNCGQLKEFHMYGDIDTFSAEQFIDLLNNKLSIVKKLTLRCEEVGNEIYEPLRKCRRLTHLRLYHAKKITDRGLNKLIRLPALMMFHLTGLRAASKYGLDTLLLNMKLELLLDLNLSATGFDNYSAKIIVDSAHKLKRLELWNCKNLTFVGIMMLTTKINTLEIFDTNVEASYKEIYCVIVLSKLKLLRIGQSPEDIPVPFNMIDPIRVQLTFNQDETRGNIEGFTANFVQYNTFTKMKGFIDCEPVREMKMPYIDYYRKMAPTFPKECVKIKIYSFMDKECIPYYSKFNLR